VTSQSPDKNFGTITPLCYIYKQVNAQPYLNNFGLSVC
jgi:hypothetical protein